MRPEERYKKILDILNLNHFISASSLSTELHVSMETVRRDMGTLEKRGELKRIHGGAVLDKMEDTNQSYLDRIDKHLEEKNQIVLKALSYIKEGQSIVLEAGTTTLELAKMLKEHFKSLTILTNSLLIATTLADAKDYKVIMTGGLVQMQEMSTVGSISDETISKFCMDICFVGIMGISMKDGLTDNGFELSASKKLLMSIAKKVIVLADNSKFDSTALIKICKINEVNTIITDSNISENVLSRYREFDVNIVIAEAPSSSSLGIDKE